MDEKGLVPFLRLPVHDEVILSMPKDDAKEISRAVADCMTFDLMGVPIAAGKPDIGIRSWGSLYGADF
jgi:DNA polymerase-1